MAGGDDTERQRLKARLLITYAFSEFEIHGLSRGESALEQALAAARGSQSLEPVALVHDLRGLFLVRSGQIDESLPEFDAAISLIDHVTPRESPALYLNRGAVHLFRGDLSAARNDLRRSASSASEMGLSRLESKALHNLGYAEFLAGNLPLALDQLARARALDADMSRTGQLDRARVLIEAGLLHEAEEVLREASISLRRVRVNQEHAEVELALAECALLQEDWLRARTHASRARREFRRRQSSGWQAKADVTRWQAYLSDKGGPTRVAREIRAASLLPDASTSAREVSLIAAEAHLALGHVGEAVGLLSQVNRRSTSDPLSSRLHQHLVRAGVARAAGDLPAARRELRGGLTRLAEQQARHHSLDLRTAMAVHGNRLAELDLRMALESVSAKAVFDSLERWRAMSHRRTAVTPSVDPELAALVSSLRLAAEDVRNAGPSGRSETLRRRQRVLERQVREREWSLQGEGRAERSTTLTALRPTLVDRSADIVAYFVLDHRLGAVAVAEGRTTVHTLAAWADVESLMTRIRADLDALAGRLLPDPLRQAIAQSLMHDLVKLDDALLPGALADVDELIVIPSRTLGAAPWSLLPRRRTRPTTVALSATGWLRGMTSLVTAPKVTAMAGPGLVLSGAEVSAVAQQWRNGVAVTSERGSAGGLAEAMVTNDVVHVAAHGSHNHDNPLFSSIRLADGPLYAYDIPADGTVASHVVLSACDLGLVTPRRGGEVLGLTAALLGIGSRCVVSGVSRIDDHVAFETMVRYHEHLAAGLDSARALAASIEDDLTAPAGFVSFGSPWQTTRSASGARP
ncbi:MAG: CHAT domain-containing protein [Actinomycetota bacterium]|nr:CHAT domain-containing protein [Actinomycetota bacterium]